MVKQVRLGGANAVHVCDFGRRRSLKRRRRGWWRSFVFYISGGQQEREGGFAKTVAKQSWDLIGFNCEPTANRDRNIRSFFYSKCHPLSTMWGMYRGQEGSSSPLQWPLLGKSSYSELDLFPHCLLLSFQPIGSDRSAARLQYLLQSARGELQIPFHSRYQDPAEMSSTGAG